MIRKKVHYCPVINTYILKPFLEMILHVESDSLQIIQSGVTNVIQSQLHHDKNVIAPQSLNGFP